MTLLRCKVLVVGDKHVGKSAIVQSFHSNGSVFPKHYVMTPGVDFCVKALHIPNTSNTVELFIFDTSGQAFYQDYRSHCWPGSNRVMVVFDISNRESFENCKYWIEQARTLSKAASLPGVLVGSKGDLAEFAQVKREEAEEFAAEHQLKYFEVSAMEGSNVDEIFHHIAGSFSSCYELKLRQLEDDCYEK